MKDVSVRPENREEYTRIKQILTSKGFHKSFSGDVTVIYRKDGSASKESARVQIFVSDLRSKKPVML